VLPGQIRFVQLLAQGRHNLRWLNSRCLQIYRAILLPDVVDAVVFFGVEQAEKIKVRAKMAKDV
jgi:hypothetical protein